MSKKIELNNLILDANSSEETYAFSADLVVDGKNIGHIRNSGNGETTRVIPNPGAEELDGSILVPDEENNISVLNRELDCMVAEILDKELVYRAICKYQKTAAVYLDKNNRIKHQLFKSPKDEVELISQLEEDGLRVFNGKTKEQCFNLIERAINA